MNKNYFQNIHYSKLKPPFFLKGALYLAEFFYKNAINLKNFLYEKNILKEIKVSPYVICIGNLTTGGVGKTPIVLEFAKELSKEKNIAIIQRGYKSKIKSKHPIVIKDFKEIKFQDGSMCGDEAFELAQKIPNNVILITSPNRLDAINFAKEKYNIDTIIMDDGFSNRKVKKDKTIVVIDSKMQFGNNHLLPIGPLREPLSEIKRADEIIVVNKKDENFNENLENIKNKFKNFNFSKCTMILDKIYNIQTKEEFEFDKLNKKRIIAFCAIGQPEQFYNYLDEFFDIEYKFSFDDHHSYSKNDIENIIKKAKELNINTFITTQKDEAKIKNILPISQYSFNVLQLKHLIEKIV